MRHLRLAATRARALRGRRHHVRRRRHAQLQPPPRTSAPSCFAPTRRRTHVFPRTPAFAWSPVSGARCYQFELGDEQDVHARTR